MSTDGRSWREELEEERAAKNTFMARHPESPFILGRVPFHDLVYFAPDEGFRVEAKLERLAEPAEAYLRTNRDNQAVMRYLGDLVFRIGGESLRLRVYHAGEGVGRSVFVPFRDRTTGKETNAQGRYLTLELNEDDRYELDFNRAFNPYCAYTDDYECSFPPSDNDLPVAIRAGERLWTASATDLPPPSRPTAVRARPVRSVRARTQAPPKRRPAAKGGAARRRSR